MIQQNSLENRKIRSMQLKNEFKPDTRFISIQEFIEHFSKSASIKNISFKIKQRNKKAISLSCKNAICTFKVNARFVAKENVCIVSKMEPFHSCNDISLDNYLNTVIKNAVENNISASIKSKDIIDKIKRETGNDVKYITAYKAIESFKTKQNINIHDSYACITSLISNISVSSAITDLEIIDGRFNRFFMTWMATKTFYSYSRKIITVDGTFLAGPNKGTLLVAVAQDGKNQLVLLAFAIVESENYDSWNYFMRNLDNNFEINNKSTILMSDRDLGLLSVVNNTLPDIIKCNCVRHLAKNLKNRFRSNNLIDKFWAMAYTYNEIEFNTILNDTRSLNEEFYNACIASDITTWANSKIPIKRYGKNTSNAAESINSALKKYVTQDICNLIVSLNNHMMRLFNMRRTEEFNFMIFPSIQTELDTNIALGRLYSISQSSENIFLVKNEFIADIYLKICSCKLTFEFGIPCKHLCAALLYIREDPLLFVENYFTVSNYIRSYSEPINPLTSNNLIRNNIEPPISRRTRGRPRISRFKHITKN